jgi:hypothetical protein
MHVLDCWLRRPGDRALQVNVHSSFRDVMLVQEVRYRFGMGVVVVCMANTNVLWLHIYY